MSKETLIILFRVEKETGHVLAIFPTEPHSHRGDDMEAYSATEGHVCAGVEYVREKTRRALPVEYANTLRTLSSIYSDRVLDVKTRMLPSYRVIRRNKQKA